MITLIFRWQLFFVLVFVPIYKGYKTFAYLLLKLEYFTH